MSTIDWAGLPDVEPETLAVAKRSPAKTVCYISATLSGSLQQAFENRVLSIADTVDAKVCIFNLLSISQAGRCEFGGAHMAGPRSKPDSIMGAILNPLPTWRGSSTASHGTRTGSRSPPPSEVGALLFEKISGRLSKRRLVPLRSLDHDRVTGPVPRDPANAYEVISRFELGKVHFRRERRGAILELRVAAGR